MTGYRLDANHVTHLFSECLDNHSGHRELERVMLANRWDGVLVRYDPLLNIAMTVTICHHCTARAAAAAAREETRCSP